MVEAGFSSYCGVDILQELFNNFLIPLLAGLISREVGLFWKLSLWSLSVIKARRSAIRSARSAMFRLVAMFLASLLIVLIVLVVAFF